MEPRELMYILLIALPAYAGAMSIWEFWKIKHPKKPAPVTHQATPSLITDKHEYVESLEGKAPQKRNRSV